jgi:SPP1 gp7 family putative phage head morphogenesis protein
VKSSPVTADDRRQARLQDQDRARIDRLGVAAAARIGFRARRAALLAYRRGDNPATAATQELHAATPLIVDAMVAGHLAGHRRSLLAVPKGKISLANASSPFLKAIEFLSERLEMEPEEYDRLEAAYQPEALKVVKTASDMVEREIETKLADAIGSGQHVRGGVAALQEAFDSAGIVPRNSFTLEAIFRTQTQLAYGAGRWQAMQDPDIREVLQSLRYVTMEDDRVRPEHVGFDGVTLPIDDPFWIESYPPNGFACRCSVIEIFDKRPLFEPRAVDVDGKMVYPSVDEGFRFNPGLLFSAE